MAWRRVSGRAVVLALAILVVVTAAIWVLGSRTADRAASPAVPPVDLPEMPDTPVPPGPTPDPEPLPAPTPGPTGET